MYKDRSDETMIAIQNDINLVVFINEIFDNLV